MSASNTDLFLKVAPNTGWQLDASGISDDSVTSFGLVSATSLPTDTAVILTVDRVDSSGNKTPTKMERIIGVMSGATVTSCVRGTEGTAQPHSAGAVVEIVISKTNINKLMEGVLVEHNQDGTHKTDINVIMSTLNPVGTIREFNVSTNPATLLGFGTWSAFGTGRVTVAIDAGQTEFDVNGETGGAKTHTLSIAELPSHNHGGATGGQSADHSHSLISAFPGDGDANSGSGFAQCDTTGSGYRDKTTGGASVGHTHGITAQGSGSSHNNLQPYIVVYRWVRTA